MCNRGKSSSALAAVAVSCTGMGDAVRALLGELEVSSVGRGDPFISEGERHRNGEISMSLPGCCRLGLCGPVAASETCTGGEYHCRAQHGQNQNKMCVQQNDR